MRFFADENLERPIIEGLRQQGHDVATVPTEEKGSPDPAVLARSSTEDRVFITNDKDLAELVFLQKQVTAGVILVRLPRFRTSYKVCTFVQALSGLSGEAGEEAAERVESGEGTVLVICTPSGGEQSVRVDLLKGWKEQMSDEDLLAAISEAQE